MGFTAIWITPVTAQWDDDVDAADATSYHGYWQKDLCATLHHELLLIKHSC